jgi:hypothetical protein
VALAGLAIKAVNAMFDAQIDRMDKATAAAKDYNAAIKSGQDIATAQARAGLSQEGDIRKIVGRGGQSGYASRYAQENNISLSDAQRAVAAAQLLKEGQRSMALGVGASVAASGEGSAGDAVEQIIKDPRLRGRLNLNIKDFGDPATFVEEMKRRQDEVASRIIAEKRGVRYSPTLAAEARANVANDPYLSQADITTGIENKGGIREQGRVANGETVAAARAAEGRAANPELSAIGDLARKQGELIDELRAKAALEKQYYGIFVGLTEIFRPGGSFESQMRRLMQANGSASLGGN